MDRLTKSILLSIAFIIFLVLLWYIRSVIAFVLVASVLSLIGRPVMLKLESWKIPTTVSALITIMTMMVVLASILFVFVPLVMEEVEIIASVDRGVVENRLADPISDLEDWMEDNGFVPEGQSKHEMVTSYTDEILGVVQFKSLFTTLINQAGNLMISVGSVLFIVFFFLKDRGMLMRFIYSVTPEKDHAKMKTVLTDSRKTLTRYFMGVLVQISVVATLVTLGLWAVGIENPILIGLLAGMANVIPYLGPIIGGFLGLTVGIATHLHLDFYSEMLPLLLKIFGVFSCVQLIDNYILQPYIISASVNAHPLEIFLVILIGGTLAGMTGMVLAVPVYSFIRIIAREYFNQFQVVRDVTKNI